MIFNIPSFHLNKFDEEFLFQFLVFCLSIFINFVFLGYAMDSNNRIHVNGEF